MPRQCHIRRASVHLLAGQFHGQLDVVDRGMRAGVRDTESHCVRLHPLHGFCVRLDGRWGSRDGCVGFSGRVQH